MLNKEKRRSIIGKSLYEFLSVICPGMLVCFIFFTGLIFRLGVMPELPAKIDSPIKFGIGHFIFLLIHYLVLSYCSGHVIQGLANVLEDITWSPRKLIKKIFKKNNIDEKFTETAYREVAIRGRAELVDMFNGHYKLMRGLFVLSLALSFALFILTFYVWHERYSLLFVGLVFSFITWYRAYHFAKLYSQELLLEFMDLLKESSINEKQLHLV
jgi:hypothetical protein